jgi:DNA-binding transcriptional LysR family regulator
VFKRTKRTLAALALTTVVGCSQIQPVTPTQIEAVTLRIESDMASATLLSTLSDTYLRTHPELQFDTSSASHETLMQRLFDNRMPYAVSSYLPRDDRLWAAPLAQDGLAIITHPDTGITHLTGDHLRRLYRGFITNWQTVDGANIPVRLYSHEEPSAAYASFERLVMGQQRISPNARVLPSSEAMLNEIATQPGAIGYLPLSQPDLSGEHVVLLAIDNISPSLEAIQANTYPLRYTVYILGLHEPQNPYRAFIGWAQSPQGQQAISPPYAPLPR